MTKDNKDNKIPNKHKTFKPKVDINDISEVINTIKNEGWEQGLGTSLGIGYNKLRDVFPEKIPGTEIEIPFVKKIKNTLFLTGAQWKQFADSQSGSRAEQVAYFMKIHVGEKADKFLSWKYGFTQAELNKLQKDVDTYKWAFDLTFLTPEKDRLRKVEEFLKKQEGQGEGGSSPQQVDPNAPTPSMTEDQYAEYLRNDPAANRIAYHPNMTVSEYKAWLKQDPGATRMAYDPSQMTEDQQSAYLKQHFYNPDDPNELLYREELKEEFYDPDIDMISYNHTQRVGRPGDTGLPMYMNRQQQSYSIDDTRLGPTNDQRIYNTLHGADNYQPDYDSYWPEPEYNYSSGYSEEYSYSYEDGVLKSSVSYNDSPASPSMTGGGGISISNKAVSSFVSGIGSLFKSIFSGW